MNIITFYAAVRELKKIKIDHNNTKQKEVLPGFLALSREEKNLRYFKSTVNFQLSI